MVVAEKVTFSTVRFGDSRNSTGNPGTDKLFTGQRLDDTGLYYYGARYYDPGIGRFISPDVFVQSPSNPQSLNRYSYVFNNPLKFIDPTGFFGEILDIPNYEGSLGWTVEEGWLVYTEAGWATIDDRSAEGVLTGASENKMTTSEYVEEFIGLPIGSEDLPGSMWGADPYNIGRGDYFWDVERRDNEEDTSIEYQLKLVQVAPGGQVLADTLRISADVIEITGICISDSVPPEYIVAAYGFVGVTGPIGAGAVILTYAGFALGPGGLREVALWLDDQSGYRPDWGAKR